MSMLRAHTRRARAEQGLWASWNSRRGRAVPSRATAVVRRIDPGVRRAHTRRLMTVKDAIQEHSACLRRQGVESPRLQVEWLLAHLLQLPRPELCLRGEALLTAEQTALLAAWVRRRAGREPLQHILGTVNFCGYELEVNRAVLIPRPETEMLAELAWNQLRERTAQGQPPAVALDFGCGSGCLAIALAKEAPGTVVHAVDVSAAALATARRNALRHGLGESVVFHRGDGFAALPAGLRFDLLVSNPPYIPSAEIERLEPEVRDHDPRLALDGGQDGLDFYRRLGTEAPAWLVPGGHLLAEFGDGQAENLRRLFSLSPWTRCEVTPDYTGRPRYLRAVVPS